VSSVASQQPSTGFWHEAFFYDSDDAYLGAMIPYINDGLDQGEAVLIAVPASRMTLLQAHLKPPSNPLLSLTPMEALGKNPAWIIPKLRDFVEMHGTSGTSARVISEPIWFGRSLDEIEECARHESLVNLAFAEYIGLRGLCPYDARTLDSAVLREAEFSHPHLTQGGARTRTDGVLPKLASQLDSPLRPVPDQAEQHTFDAGSVASIRRRFGVLAATAGFPSARVDDFVVAVSEAMTNSVCHAGGSGEAVIWQEESRMVCEIRDRGQISDPLAGRTRPPLALLGGRGLWLMHQLCDLVQIRIVPNGQIIRLHLCF
jgi:anti-sigma regulatory factor (Ser/Thr protein kinase)